MTKEKILKTEILKDEQLDNISGGILHVRAQRYFARDIATGQFEFIPPAQSLKQQFVAQKF